MLESEINSGWLVELAQFLAVGDVPPEILKPFWLKIPFPCLDSKKNAHVEHVTYGEVWTTCTVFT